MKEAPTTHTYPVIKDKMYKRPYSYVLSGLFGEETGWGTEAISLNRFTAFCSVNGNVVYLWHFCLDAITSILFQDVLAKLLQPLSNIIMEVGQLKDKNFKDKVYSSYTGAINEAVAAFGWVTISPAPAPYVKECGNGTQFYTNRILKLVKTFISMSIAIGNEGP